MRPPWGVALAVCLVFMLTPLSRLAGAQPLDPSRYPPARIAAVVGEEPRQGGLVIAPGPAFRARVSYSGDFRIFAPETGRLLTAWAVAMSRAEVPRLVQHELRVTEADTDYWVAVQGVLVPTMKAELTPGEAIDVYLLYMGQVDGRHVFVVNAFDHEPHR